MRKVLLLIIVISLSAFCKGTIIKNKTEGSEGKDSSQYKAFIDFEATLLTGEKFKLSDYKGKIILLNFWFISCPPCLGEIGDINKTYRTFKDSNVVILSLAINSVEQLNKFNNNANTKREKIEYPIVPEAQKIADLYKIQGYPTTLIIDKQGFIRLYAGATIQSLKNYVVLYGDKNLSKSWKKMLKENANENSPETSEVLSKFISDLLKE